MSTRLSSDPERSHALANIRKQMLADMVPFTGQYADKDRSGTIYNKYNIFSGTGGALLLAKAILKLNTAAFVALYHSNNTSNYYLYAFAKGLPDGKSNENNIVGAIGESEAYKRLIFDVGLTAPLRTFGLGLPNPRIYFGRKASGTHQVDLQEVVPVYNSRRGLFRRSNSAGIKYYNFDGSYAGISEYHADLGDRFNFKINYEVKALNAKMSVEKNFGIIEKGFRQIRERGKEDHSAVVLVVDEDAWNAVANDSVLGRD